MINEALISHKIALRLAVVPCISFSKRQKKYIVIDYSNVQDVALDTVQQHKQKKLQALAGGYFPFRLIKTSHFAAAVVFVFCFSFNLMNRNLEEHANEFERLRPFDF